MKIHAKGSDLPMNVKIQFCFLFSAPPIPFVEASPILDPLHTEEEDDPLQISAP